ncbi:MAG: penicillin-binding protein 2 [bacterium]|nr:penicillin-binding protein 2 [bacterium]
MKNNLIEFDKAKKKLQHLSIFFFVVLLAILIRLFYLQVVKGNYFCQVSEKNRIQLIPIPAPRGVVYDCKETPLVKIGPSFDIMVVQIGLKKEDIENIARKLSCILNIKTEKIIAFINKKKSLPCEPALVAENVSKDVVIRIAEHKMELPGVIIQVNPKRFYVYGELASHLLGYIGEVSKKDIERDEERRYKTGDLIGKTGIEKTLDDYLRGENGGKQVEVDAKGRKIRILSCKEPKAGRNVYLTINRQVQEIAEEAIKDKQGAVVILNSDNGKVLALVSKPSFNPNMFTSRLGNEVVKKILEHPNHIFMNRAIQAEYSPGSVFKIIVKTAALEKNIINIKKKVFCKGKYFLGKKEFKCWEKAGHGEVDLLKAIIKSCNVYFYGLGAMVGINSIVDVAEKFGIGEKTNIVLSEEKKGLLPSPRWKREKFNEGWYLGETINCSVGQGYLLVTPIQMACMISGVGNKEVIYRPMLIEKVENSNRDELIDYEKPEVKYRLNFKDKTLKLLDEGLKDVVRLGTGWRACVWRLKVAGKTGTSQNPHGEDHAWFVCYTEINGVNLGICILVEHGGGGGKAAAPIAGEILSKIKMQGIIL